MQTKKPRSISETLIEAIEESGLSFKAIETQTGVKRQSLMKFVRGEQSLRLDLADKLADFFGLVLTKKQTRKDR
jgi:plasmid maintenance system antidote protein VapI